MMFPYQGEALEVFNKAFPFTSYCPNKTYRNPFGRYVYVNTKGFLHTLVPCRIKEDGKVVGYEIDDYMLTKSGKLKFVQGRGWFSTREACIQEILSFRG